VAVSKGSKTFLAVLLFLGLLGALGGSWLFATGGAGDEVAEGEPVAVVVPEGAGASTVADILEAEGVISSATAFRLAARFDERSGQLQAGTYELRAGMSTDEILDVLSEPPEAREFYRVTIPEGLTVDQILTRFADASPYGEDELEGALADVALPDWVPVDELPEGADPYEGMLFPDTYEFFVDEAPAEVLARLVAQTDAVLAEVDPPGELTRYEVLVVASLIEREARLREEQELISSVIHNRLAQPMRLQIDATVQYARGEHTDRLLYEDLDVDSPWNTYQVDGLPPTPIANAGRGAITAAASPADTAYLFYVVNDLETGAHAFAETQSEHDQNVAEYRRMRDEAQADDG
jgi:UPF0755 protein